MTNEDFKKRMNEAKEEENEIKEQLLSVEDQEEPRTVGKEEIIQALQDTESNWMFLEYKEKKSLVQQIVKEIHYRHRGKNVEIMSVDFL